MLSRITILVLLISFMAQAMNRSVILIDYMFNTAAFEKNCINKSKPKLNCHGKCQMSKKMQQQEEKEQQQQVNTAKADFVLSSRSFFAEVPEPFTTKLDGYTTLLNSGAPVHRSFDIFHPPA